MDREKLMFALEMCSTGICSPKECPYNKDDYDSTTNCDDDQMRDALALLKEQEETRTIICQRCGDEIEIKWSLLTKPDMEAIAKRDAFLSEENGKKLRMNLKNIMSRKEKQ